MADETESPLSGAERAAVLLMSLGEESAAAVLKHMGPKEVQVLGNAMASMQRISQGQVNSVVQAFMGSVRQHTALGIDSDRYVRNALVQALGADKASGLIDRILLGGNASGLETLKWMEPKSIAEIVGQEHPQVVAIVLSFLEKDQSAAILSLLPEAMRADVLMRISSLDSIQPAALKELDSLLQEQVSGNRNAQSASVGGVKAAADILNFMDSQTEGAILEAIRASDADLGEQIQDLMFVFENLLEVEDTAVQALLREVSSESLLVALKGADERMRDKFFGNMSKRAAEMMRDDLEAKGPVRLSEVEMAQKEIIGIARRMSDEGQIALGGRGAEQFV